MMDRAAGAKTKKNKISIHSVLIDWKNLTPLLFAAYLCHRLSEKGVDLKTAQYLLGHTDIKMTAEIYTHVTDKMLKDARDKNKRKI